MVNNLRIWLKDTTHKLFSSIGFYPALIALSFLVLSWLSISFDFSESGMNFKSQLKWISLNDATTARSIISAITAGIISLTVFSFTMVMIVLNQTASQMSNRILDQLIGGRFQQVVLGIYIGTILYALFLLSTIRDIDSGIRIPALSTYLLILLTILNLFLFIYFLHFITQSVKYAVIIKKITDETQEILNKERPLLIPPALANTFNFEYKLEAKNSGIYQGFSKHILINICDQLNCTIFLIYKPGTFILKGTPIALIDKPFMDEKKDELINAIYIHAHESIEENFIYGFKLLKEVAIKALSPGINDPGTAVQCIRSLFKLFVFSICHYQHDILLNHEKQIRIITKNITFDEIFKETILPIWDYGKNDWLIQNELHHLILQLQQIKNSDIAYSLLTLVNTKINERTIG
ncbi:MAG: DUF2254 family protein [Bacteroidia bacterium]